MTHFLTSTAPLILTISLSLTTVTGFGQAGLKQLKDGNDNEQFSDSSRLTFCSCDSLKLIDGTRLYNTKKRLAHCGYFKEYKMIYGLRFVYAGDTALIAIEKYYRGRIIGECKIK